MNFKAKGNALVSVLTCNVMMAAFQDEENWPDSFVKVCICLCGLVLVWETVKSRGTGAWCI